MKKGFTLIELLAVIVILAIIALIATPIILNIIKEAKINAAVQSANGYIDAVNLSLAKNQFNNGSLEDNTYNILETDLKAKYKGTSPSHGLVTILKGSVTSASLCIDGYPIEYKNGKAYYDKNSTICPTEYKFVEPEGTIISELCNGGTYKVGSYKIKTVEDLVCFGKLVDEGNNFSGSTVMLLSDLDINNKSTYKNADVLASYDINENGTIESIYTELTTEKGFNPIGIDSNKPFSGIFEGYGFNINNLYINRTTDYTGLFAYNTGTIQGLNVNNINIHGTKCVGGISGYSTGLINEVNLNGTMIGTNWVGGIVGDLGRTTENEIGMVKNALSNVTVTGSMYVGGLVGESYGTATYKTSVYGIVDGGTITGTSSTGKLIGSSNTDRSLKEGYANSNVTASTGSGNYYFHGTAYTKNTVSAYESILDTVVGGDNDSSGYYFDYNESGDFIVKSVLKEPLKLKLNGKGTEDDPYIIKSVNDWNNATLTVNQNKYYKLTSNLDFKDKMYYPMGSNLNYFNGEIDGNGYTIKNVEIDKPLYAGLFGYNTGVIEGINFENITINTLGEYSGLVAYNTGTIQGLNVNNINIHGTKCVGGISGYSTGLINEVNLNGTMIGTNWVGGIVGDLGRTTENEIGMVKNALSNVTVTGSMYVGGLVGESYGTATYKTSVYGIVDGGTITGTSSTGKLIGSSVTSRSLREGYVSSDVLASTETGNNFYSGTIFGEEYLNDLDYYNKILDTIIDGDSDSSGYYFDYNDAGDDIIVIKAGTTSKFDSSDVTNDKITTADASSTDTTAPTCTLTSFYPRSQKDGMTASFTCTDNVDVTNISSYFSETRTTAATSFKEIGTLKRGIKITNGMKWNSIWTASTDPEHIPNSGKCYYFHFGAEDAQGNFSSYVTNYCLSY